MKIVNVGQLEVNMCVEELELLVELWHIAINEKHAYSRDGLPKGLEEIHARFRGAADSRSAEPVYAIIGDLVVYARLLLLSKLLKKSDDAIYILNDLQDLLTEIRFKLITQRGASC